jgi:AhpC/TSA family
MMMKQAIMMSVFGALGLAITLAAPAMATPVIGQLAPAFTGTDSNGKAVSLGDFADQTVVLEWTNHDCPYVRKHYDSGNMQALQGEAAAQGVVWLTVVSSAPGREGYVDGAEANALTKSRSAKPSAVILDPTGTIGHAYEAKTTPHMFIIDKGKLAFMGGIDDIRSTRKEDIPKATNYVRAALAELKAGKSISKSETTPYGCSVKY